MFTVDVEAKKNANLAIDCDKFRRKYRVNEQDLEVTFSAPSLATLEKYRFYLLKNSNKKVLDPKCYYRPDYISYDEYKTVTLWYLILFVNDISCIEEFNKYEIYVPTFEAILEICGETLDRDISQLDVSQQVYPKKDRLNLYDTKIEPNFDYQTPTGEEEWTVPQLQYWARQTFTITDGQAQNGFVDLNFEPITETIEFKTEHAGNHLYGIDYVLVNAVDGKHRRISWAASNFPSGGGLQGLLRTGMLLELAYAKRIRHNENEQ